MTQPTVSPLTLHPSVRESRLEFEEYVTDLKGKINEEGQLTLSMKRFNGVVEKLEVMWPKCMLPGQERLPANHKDKWLEDMNRWLKTMGVKNWDEFRQSLAKWRLEQRQKEREELFGGDDDNEKEEMDDDVEVLTDKDSNHNHHGQGGNMAVRDYDDVRKGRERNSKFYASKSGRDKYDKDVDRSRSRHRKGKVDAPLDPDEDEAKRSNRHKKVCEIASVAYFLVISSFPIFAIFILLSQYIPSFSFSFCSFLHFLWQSVHPFEYKT